MDFKGVDWAGNMHEKFETMYSEVEETIQQDTVNYVENQLQKVGESVMKFYAEVLEELYTSSCILPIRGAAKPSTRTDINKKKVDGGEDMCDSTAEDSSLRVHSDAKHLSTVSHRVLVGNTQSGECSKKSKAAGVSRHSIGIKIVSHTPKVSPKIVRDVKSKCLVSSDDLNVTKSSEPFVSNDTGEAVTTKMIKNKCISDASVESCNSDQILSSESVKQEKEKNSECICPAPDKDSSAESPRQNEGASVESCNSDQILSTESVKQEKEKNSECICPAPDKDSSAESPRQNKGATNDIFDIEVIETEDVEKSKMEHHFVSQGTKKYKSYKKKIYDVLSLKSRPTSKQDAYVSDHEDFDWELL